MVYKDEISPLFGLFEIILVGAIGMGIGAGMLIAILAFLTVMGVISTGVISSAIIVGYYEKSLTKALRTIVILSFTIAGPVIGTIIPWIVIEILDIPNMQILIIIGAVCGLIIGYGLGHLALWFLKFVILYFKRKLNINY
ncbi:hypothetical protein [Dyadobacter psychrotolerans]|uniref:Uncharacterized protein n=1 Tax=Dyadobacter psychrotolerans TaxID=2541721 RepID=A0A4R5E1C9_9BACT|nr:hypothetical protein [Dyadobacter psychrotolerans]TDE17543.1 hypothetical protein E0F88_06535 [Dyadobacter psychrotolerans]